MSPCARMHQDDEHHLDDDDDNDVEDDDVELDESPNYGDDAGKKGKKKRDANSLRKAPQAPKRFKSSYICFFMAKQPEIKQELGEKATVTAVSKRSAEMWYVLICVACLIPVHGCRCQHDVDPTHGKEILLC
jgi:hypothetical protein